MRPLILVFTLCAAYSLAGSVSPERVIALTLYLEAGNQDTVGKECVASVIWNRAGGDPKKLVAVCLAKKQFSCWNKRRPASVKVKTNVSYRICELIAKDMVRGTFCVPYRMLGVNYYHEKSVHPDWGNPTKRVCREGDHLFYRI